VFSSGNRSSDSSSKTKGILLEAIKAPLHLIDGLSLRVITVNKIPYLEVPFINFRRIILSVVDDDLSIDELQDRIAAAVSNNSTTVASQVALDSLSAYLFDPHLNISQGQHFSSLLNWRFGVG